jgi:hypothetical protein
MMQQKGNDAAIYFKFVDPTRIIIDQIDEKLFLKKVM